MSELGHVPVNRELEMAADGWAVAESASQIRLAPVTRPLHGREEAAYTAIFPALHWRLPPARSLSCRVAVNTTTERQPTL